MMDKELPTRSTETWIEWAKKRIEALEKDVAHWKKRNDGEYWKQVHELTAENKRLREALDEACEPIKTRARVGTRTDYANGVARGAQLQRMIAEAAREKALNQAGEGE